MNVNIQSTSAVAGGGASAGVPLLFFAPPSLFLHELSPTLTLGVVTRARGMAVALHHDAVPALDEHTRLLAELPGGSTFLATRVSLSAVKRWVAFVRRSPWAWSPAFRIGAFGPADSRLPKWLGSSI